MTDGVVFVAIGRDYLELATASAETVKHWNPGLQVDIFTDLEIEAEDGPFDRVHRPPIIHERAKVDCMPLSRFDRTLYLDADTLVTAPFGNLFGILDRFELALCHDVRRNTDLVQEGHAEKTPYAFPQLNSGVFLYRRSRAVADFLSEWKSRYRLAGRRRDQITLKDLLWRSDIRFYVLPPEFNLRRVTLLDAWEPGDVRPTIIHSHRFLDHLKNAEAPRIRTLEQLLGVERLALDAEWASVGAAEKASRAFHLLLGEAIVNRGSGTGEVAAE